MALLHCALNWILPVRGDSIQTARDNLREALELFFECASPDEISDRLGEDVFVTHVKVSIA